MYNERFLLALAAVCSHSADPSYIICWSIVFLLWADSFFFLVFCTWTHHDRKEFAAWLEVISHINIYYMYFQRYTATYTTPSFIFALKKKKTEKSWKWSARSWETAFEVVPLMLAAGSAPEYSQRHSTTALNSWALTKPTLTIKKKKVELS